MSYTSPWLLPFTVIDPLSKSFTISKLLLWKDIILTDRVLSGSKVMRPTVHLKVQSSCSQPSSASAALSPQNPHNAVAGSGSHPPGCMSTHTADHTLSHLSFLTYSRTVHCVKAKYSPAPYSPLQLYRHHSDTLNNLPMVHFKQHACIHVHRCVNVQMYADILLERLKGI